MFYTHGYRHGDNQLSTGSQASLHHLKYSLHVEWIALNPINWDEGQLDMIANDVLPLVETG